MTSHGQEKNHQKTDPENRVEETTGREGTPKTGVPQQPVPLEANPAVDIYGRVFNPEKFFDRKDKLGRWINRRGGRKPTKKQTMDTPSETHTPEPEYPDFSDIQKQIATPSPSPDSQPGEFAAVEVESITVESAIGIIQTALCMIGEEEGMLSDLEKKMLRRPLQRVMDKYSIGDDALPAEIELAVCCATLLVTRLQKPKTQTWFQRMKHGFKNWVMNRKGAKVAKTLREDLNHKPQTEGAV